MPTLSLWAKQHDFQGLPSAERDKDEVEAYSGSSIIFIDVLSIIMYKFGERIAKVSFNLGSKISHIAGTYPDNAKDISCKKQNKT